MSRKFAPINVIVYYPKTDEERRELTKRVAQVHADVVEQKIQKLNCPSEQKLALIDSVIKSVKENSGKTTT